MKDATKEDLLSITATFLDTIEHLGTRFDTQKIHLTPQIVVSVELTFTGNLEILSAAYKVFDAKTNKFREIGAYDKELTTKLQHTKENGIKR